MRTKSKPQHSGGVAKLSKIAIVVISVAIIVAAFGYWRVYKFLHSAGLRNMVEQAVAEKTGVDLELEPLAWEGLSLNSQGLSASSDSSLVSAKLLDLAANVSTNYLVRDVWRISGVEIGELDLVVDLTKSFTLPEIKDQEPSGWLMQKLPQRLELEDVSVDRLDLQAITPIGPVGLMGVQLDLEQIGSGFQADLVNGSCVTPFGILRGFELERAKLRLLGSDELLLQQCDVKVFDHATISTTGDMVRSRQGHWDVDLGSVVRGLRAEEILEADWKQKLQGDLNGTLRWKMEDERSRVDGSIDLSDAVLTALPVLDTISAYTELSDFRRLKIDSLKADYSYRDGRWKLTNLRGLSKGLMELSGDITWDANKIEGLLEVGVHPRVLTKIPGAEGGVFLPGKDGMAWTTMRISGSPDHIQEDLSDRLKAAAVGRILEVVSGIDSLEKSASAAKEFSKPAIEATSKVIQSGVEAPIELGSGVLDAGADFFGGLLGRDEDPEAPGDKEGE